MNTIGKFVAAASLALASSVTNAGAVVAARNSSLSQIDADQARRLFLGLQRNINGQPVSVIYQATGPVRTDFETKVIGKTGAELMSYLTMLIFTGRALPPSEVTNDDSVKKRVNGVPHAIGYVSDDAVDDSVKVLFRY